MKTLEDQIRDYAGFVADETHTYENRVVEQLGTQSAQSTFTKSAEPKKRKRTVALVALLAAGSATTFGVAAQFAGGPKPQEVRFLPLSASEQGHYAPSYLPPEFVTRSITKTTDTSGEFKRIMIFGRIKEDKRIVDGLFASQIDTDVSDESLVRGDGRVLVKRQVFEIDGEMVPGRITVLDGATPDANLRSVTVPLEGCGYLSLGALTSSTHEKFASYLANFSCRDGQIVGAPPSGTELLYSAPWTEGDATSYWFEYIRPVGGQLNIMQPSNSFPPELFVLLNRFEEMLGPNTTLQQLGGRTVMVSNDSRSGFTGYRWTQDNAQLMMSVSPEVTKSEAEKVLASVHKLTDEEWAEKLKAHPPLVTTIIDGKAVTATPVAG
jgi:hypothetical protein